MKGRKLRTIFALLMAMALLAPLAAPAEDAIEATPEVLIVEETEAVSEETEALPGEAAEDLTLPPEDAVLPSEPTDAPEPTDTPVPADTPEPAPSATAEASAVSNAVPEQITLGVKEKYTLNAVALVPDARVTYKSSKPKVASVSQKGVVRARKKGTAVISCYSGGALLADCTVTVVAAPKKVSLGMTKLTVGLKETYRFTPTVTKGAHASFTWSSSKKSVASVSKAGKITGKRKGKATITVKTHNGKTARVTVTVVAAPKKVTLNKGVASLHPGETVQLKATLPKKTASRITWSSSDSAVATVSASGKVTAVAAGQVTVTASTFNGKTASCVVTVSIAPTPTPTPKPTPTPTPTPKPTATSASGVILDGAVKYRALLIGEERFKNDYCPRNRGDVAMMADMLGTVRGLYGGSYSITKKYDLSSAQILKAIKNTFAGADDNDVSLFFIATHGDVTGTGAAAGELITCPDDKLRFNRLADALKAVPGKVIVILESCGSGAAVYANGQTWLDSAEASARAFDAAAVEAFSEADPGIEAQVPQGGLNSSGVRSNTGELRLENKFYVLTASRYQELSWGIEDDYGEHFNFFTLWLTEGIGTAGHMPADTDRDGRTTLEELYSYISKVGDDYAFQYNRKLYYQHVQVYPANSDFVLFTR